MSVVAHHSWLGKQSELDTSYSTVTNDPDDIIDQVIKYHKRCDLHCVKCWVDATTNEYFAYRLQTHHLLPVETVHWSLQKKERLISHLETCLQSRRLKIPNADPIKRELISYSYDWDRMKDHEERRLFLGGMEDDWVSSLAMLSQSITTQQACQFKPYFVTR